MIDKIIYFSIKNKLSVGLFVLLLTGWGIYSFSEIPIDAVPDITTNQVQILTQSPSLATQEVEQFVTFPVELAMANLPDVVEIRSISRFGISVVTVVFKESVDIYLARQLISEQLDIAKNDIPDGFGTPEMGPITSGLGEVYQYVLHADEGYEDVYTDMELRSINDWIVKRQLAGTPGVIEVSSWGGHLKQYEVAVNPLVLNSMDLSISDVFDALERNNENTGGSYIEKRYNTYFIRGEGLVKSLEDIEKIVVRTVDGMPVLVRDIATVGYGNAPRYGAMTYNGTGEVVGGQTLMLKGENSYEVVNRVKEKVEEIKKSLPEGVVLTPFLDRSELIGRAVNTVTENLILGGLIVIFILILLLGNIRGGFIVASTIPLSMLIALGLMNLFDVSANLMSLGALDFGIIVDGAVIIVESVVFYISTNFVSGKKLTQDEKDEITYRSSSKMMGSAFFGQLIILVVFIPILTLTGIEGKMFRPMAQTVSFAMIGAIFLSLTYVPMMTSLFLRMEKPNEKSIASRIHNRLIKIFEPLIMFALNFRKTVLISAGFLLIASIFLYSRLGGEFIPTLEEGDFALHQILPPGSSLQQSVEVSAKIQQILLDEFPEVIAVVSKIGSAEVPTDPMPIEVGDIMVKMKPKKEWTTASNREEMFEIMEKRLSIIPGVQYEFTQPIQMRFNELIAGAREDIAIKIFGDDNEVLFRKAKEAEQIIKDVQGIGDLRVEQTQGLPQMMVEYERDKVAKYGLDITTLNRILRAAFAGETAGVVFEGERRFDLVVRLEKEYRQSIEDIKNLYVPVEGGGQVPMRELASIEFKEGPMQISREGTKRRINVGVNARGRDIESLVEEIRDKLEAELELPPAYHIEYGGTFENLRRAKQRLSFAVPLAIGLIFILVFSALRSLKQTIMIHISIPLAAIGGIFLLWFRDMPFSISAGIGFIVLSGVAVLNGLVLINSFNDLKSEGNRSLKEILLEGSKRRIRPIMLTAATDILGFLPMAISNSAGAEVQRPLATVVIGGLITATLLTLVVLPVLYYIFEDKQLKKTDDAYA
ncbi:MAG: efflux RND transporter permease subunit [Chitinophagales bacterium]|nr:efflux RND transporter permease subunit [Chitinophagales bacterium]